MLCPLPPQRGLAGVVCALPIEVIREFFDVNPRMDVQEEAPVTHCVAMRCWSQCRSSVRYLVRIVFDKSGSIA